MSSLDTSAVQQVLFDSKLQIMIASRTDHSSVRASLSGAVTDNGVMLMCLSAHVQC
jgi:hypothetical protein